MNKLEIQNKLMEIIFEGKDVMITEVDINVHLKKYVVINSLEFLEKIITIEDTFNIIIPDEDLSFELFKTINHISNYVINKLEETESLV